MQNKNSIYLPNYVVMQDFKIWAPFAGIVCCKDLVLRWCYILFLDFGYCTLQIHIQIKQTSHKLTLKNNMN
jgi:hypothetical protein